MLLDRLFGVAGAAAFLLGLVCQAGWQIDLVEPSRLYQLTGIFVALAFAVFFYFLLYVGKRDGFPYTLQGELDLGHVFAMLPGWARVVSYWLFGIAAAFMAAMLVAIVRPDLLPEGRCLPGTGDLPEDCLFANLVISTMIATFGALSFVDAVYLLRTTSRT